MKQLGEQQKQREQQQVQQQQQQIQQQQLHQQKPIQQPRISQPAPSSGAVRHSYTGCGVATRSGVIQRNKQFCSGLISYKNKSNTKNIKNEKETIKDKLQSPFGFQMVSTPNDFIDTDLSYVLKGPINKIKGGCCWLDAVLGLGLTIIDDWSCFNRKTRKIPLHYNNNWAKQESIHDSLCRFYKIWISCDFDEFYFRKDLSVAHDILWMKFEENGFTYGESHCVIDAFKFLVSIISDITKKVFTFY